MRITGWAALLLWLACPGTACAVWGPFGGVGRLESGDAPAGVFEGYEAGVIAFGPNGEGFWQAAFTRLDRTDGPERITRAGARLNFALLSGTAGLFYAGAGGGRNWITTPAGDRTRWSWGAQAGLLLSPQGIWREFPGRRRGLSPAPGKIGTARGAFLLGAEAGWSQGPAPLQGFEFRGFVTLVY